MTRSAYGLDKIQEKRYNATTDATTGALAPDAQTTANIRLLDPNLVSDAFAQLEQYRPYYQFPKRARRRPLRRGRQGPGHRDCRPRAEPGRPERQPAVLAQPARRLHPRLRRRGRQGQQVHGRRQAGVPAGRHPVHRSPRQRCDLPAPHLLRRGLARVLDRRRPGRCAAPEQDHPAGKEGDGETQYTFTGNGGPNVGSFFNRLLYSIKFQSSELLLSDGVNADSQILYDRNPRERVEKVAPYLTVDGNAYPAVVDGRVKWIVDGYTTSQYYPYSQQEQLVRGDRRFTDHGRAHRRLAEQLGQLHPQLGQGHR